MNAQRLGAVNELLEVRVRYRLFCRVSCPAGGAEPLDLPGAPVDDEVVLDAVALLLAAVELSLPLGILGALDGALHSVDDETEESA